MSPASLLRSLCNTEFGCRRQCERITSVFFSALWLNSGSNQRVCELSSPRSLGARVIRARLHTAISTDSENPNSTLTCCCFPHIHQTDYSSVKPACLYIFKLSPESVKLLFRQILYFIRCSVKRLSAGLGEWRPAFTLQMFKQLLFHHRNTTFMICLLHGHQRLTCGSRTCDRDKGSFSLLICESVFASQRQMWRLQMVQKYLVYKEKW